MTEKRAELLLAAVISARATSFVFNKLVLGSLAIVCTGFGFTLQPVAQSHTNAERAGLFCALSPACATLFGAVLLHEKITLLGAAGILLILSSLLLPHLMKGKRSHEVQGDPV